MSKEIIPIERIARAIFLFREQKVMLDYDLAVLYGIETRAPKQAVRRNRDRFPSDFMFELSSEEVEIVVSRFVIPNRRKLGGAKPMAFTEQGVAMLSSVLNSQRAVKQIASSHEHSGSLKDASANTTRKLPESLRRSGS